MSSVRATVAHDAWLDGLRAIAALMVFMVHAAPGTYIGGWDAGVMLFFSLSGYLLYRPFLERDVDLRAYAVRRLFRIFPAYLFATIGIAYLTGQEVSVGDTLTMDHTLIAVAWTLKIEVVFYAALPVMAWIARGRRQPLLAIAAASLAFAGVEMLFRPVIPVDFLAWAWAFIPGMVVAYIAVRRPDVLSRAHRPVVPLIGVALVACSVIPDIRFPDVPASVGSAIVLAWLLGCSPPPRHAATGMAVGAALSYSVYLWHEAILDGLGRPVGIVGVFGGLLVTCVVAALAYVLVERPGIYLGRRLAGRPRVSLKPAVSSAALPESGP